MKKKTLEKLGQALYDQVYMQMSWLHNGGCGFAAVALIEALEKMGEEARLVTRNHYSHILVEVKVQSGRSVRKVIIDCLMTGYTWDNRYAYGDLKQLKKDLKTEWGWNNMFDRRQVPTLRRKIRKVVKDVLKPCTEPIEIT